jgi:hypothetical protein
MVATPESAPALNKLLNLTKDQRATATLAIGKMSIEDQVALLCDTPLARRSEIISLLPSPETVIPLIPEAELCFTVKAIGIEDSAWILECATPEQVVACVDLDAWHGYSADRVALDRWLDVLAMSNEETFFQSIQALDAELVVLFLKHRIACIQKPDDDDDWEIPEGGQTIDDAFYIVALRDSDDLEAVLAMLRSLFVADYWTYFRMMQGVIHELDTNNEEWALRWRTGRLEDLGFPTWDRAMEIYRFIRPELRAQVPEAGEVLAVGEWHLPVWMPRLPVSRDEGPLLFRAFAQLDDSERRGTFFSFIALANRIAVADRMELSDAESTPKAIEKAADFASAGLEFVAAESGLDIADVVRRVGVQRLFSIGANLDPDRARPQKSVEPSES